MKKRSFASKTIKIYKMLIKNSRVSVDLGELNLASSETSSESGASEEAVEMPTPEGLTNSMKILSKNVKICVVNAKFHVFHENLHFLKQVSRIVPLPKAKSSRRPAPGSKPPSRTV